MNPLSRIEQKLRRISRSVPLKFRYWHANVDRLTVSRDTDDGFREVWVHEVPDEVPGYDNWDFALYVGHYQSVHGRNVDARNAGPFEFVIELCRRWLIDLDDWDQLPPPLSNCAPQTGVLGDFMFSGLAPRPREQVNAQLLELSSVERLSGAVLDMPIAGGVSPCVLAAEPWEDWTVVTGMIYLDQIVRDAGSPMSVVLELAVFAERLADVLGLEFFGLADEDDREAPLVEGAWLLAPCVFLVRPGRPVEWLHEPGDPVQTIRRQSPQVLECRNRLLHELARLQWGPGRP